MYRIMKDMFEVMDFSYLSQILLMIRKIIDQH